MPDQCSILLIDDHPIIHDGLKILLEAEPDLEISDAVFSAKEAFKSLKKQLPDLAIVDLSLGGSDGAYMVQKIKKLYPRIPILIYTMSEEKLFAERTALAGANGYIMKTSPPSELKEAIRKVWAGEQYFAPDILERIEKRNCGRAAGAHSIIDTLSNREIDIFKLLGEGLNSAQIAEKLKISRNTVDTHRINIKNKLELPNGKALDHVAFEAIRNGRIPEA